MRINIGLSKLGEADSAFVLCYTDSTILLTHGLIYNEHLDGITVGVMTMVMLTLRTEPWNVRIMMNNAMPDS